MKNISGTIAAAGVAQSFIDPQGQPYKGFFIRNYSTSTSLWINENGTATAATPSIEIKPGELYETPLNYGAYTEPWSIICSVISQPFAARMW